MLGPSIAAGLTSHLDAFSVMLPGLWCQALSPLFLAYYPSVESAILWVALLSIGEVAAQGLQPWTSHALCSLLLACRMPSTLTSPTFEP